MKHTKKIIFFISTQNNNNNLYKISTILPYHVWNSPYESQQSKKKKKLMIWNLYNSFIWLNSLLNSISKQSNQVDRAAIGFKIRSSYAHLCCLTSKEIKTIKISLAESSIVIIQNVNLFKFNRIKHIILTLFI